MEFRRVPSYYDIASTFDNAYFSSNDAFLKDKGIGHNNLGFYPEDENEDVQTVSLFSDALIRNMQEKGFFPIKTGDINMISKNFFKAEFHLPPDVPTGLYTVETFIVREDKVISHQSRKLQVGQVGFNAGVYLYAQQHSLLYGIFTVMVALISGWSAFTFLRRD